MALKIDIKPFDELTAVDVYHILRARSQVFVVEQNCPYQDIDGLDFDSLHLVAHEDFSLIGYCRIIPPTAYTDLVAVTSPTTSSQRINTSFTDDNVEDNRSYENSLDGSLDGSLNGSLGNSNPSLNLNKAHSQSNVDRVKHTVTMPIDSNDSDSETETVHTYGKLAIGRVLVLPKHRGRGLSRKMMQQAIAYCRKNFKKQPIHLSAQTYLIEFYQSLGFKPIDEPYQLDGIEHIDMVLDNAKRGKFGLGVLKKADGSSNLLAILILVMIFAIILGAIVYYYIIYTPIA